MDKVYVVLEVWEYEGTHVVGVYTSRKDAVKAQEHLDKTESRCGQVYEVHEVPLNTDIRL